MTPAINSYYSGAGLMDIGLAAGGVHVQASYEIDRQCVDVARRNGLNSNVSDITLKLVADEPDCDAMVATYPCTRYSTASEIHGLRVGDEHFLHFFRHVAIKRPQVFVVENVPGIRKFPVVMEALTKLPDYYVTVFCPVQSEIWLPQRRDRLFVIGSRRNFQWNAPRSNRRRRLSDIIERNPRVTIPAYFHRRVKGHYRDLPIVCDPRRDDIAPTCVAHYGKDVSTRVVKVKGGYRPFSVREYARLQGVPDSFSFDGVSDSTAYKMIGNGVSIPAAEWIARELRRYFK